MENKQIDSMQKDEYYDQVSKIFKAFSDSNRLRILDMLRNGERCAYQLLEALQVTQPTLSHHMNILCDSGIVSARREGKWTLYRIQCCEFRSIALVLNEMADDCNSEKASQMWSDCGCNS
jgi:ArsR family transcriptional regulator